MTRRGFRGSCTGGEVGRGALSGFFDAAAASRVADRHAEGYSGAARRVRAAMS